MTPDTHQNCKFRGLLPSFHTEAHLEYMFHPCEAVLQFICCGNMLLVISDMVSCCRQAEKVETLEQLVISLRRKLQVRTEQVSSGQKPKHASLGRHD